MSNVNLTEEQIIKTVREVTEEISKNTATEFLESLEKTTKDLPEKLKNDPLMYHEIAIAYTQGKISIMIQEILCRLFCDETA